MKLPNEIMLFLVISFVEKKIEHQNQSVFTAYFDVWIFPDFDAEKEQNEFILHSYTLNVNFLSGMSKKQTNQVFFG